MRRASFCAALSVLVLGVAGAAEPREAKSAIVEVTVYPDHALVTRSARVTLGAGKGEVVLGELPAELADDSIRVRAEGAVVRGVRVEKVFLERAGEAEVRALQDGIQALRDEGKALDDELAVLSSETGFLRKLQGSVPSRAAQKLGEGELKLPDVASTEGLLDFALKRLSANAAKRREIARKKRDLAPKLSAKERELAEKRSAGRLEHKTVSVALESARGGEVTVRISYLLPGALWFPSYDVRADIKKGEMELVYYAVIQQATGEDWTGASLTLSASQPVRSSARPRLAPWLIGGVPLAYNPPIEQAVQSSSQWWSPGANYLAGQYDTRDARWQEAHQKLLPNASRIIAVQRTLAKRGTSVVFPVPTRETVRTDGRPHRVVLAIEKLAMTPEYSAVPSLSLATYVTGRAANAGKLPLLPGDASVYLAGDLIGRSRVDFVAPGEKTEFYLGVEESIKVTRKVDGKRSSMRSRGRRRRVEAAYSIQVENFMERPVTVRIE